MDTQKLARKPDTVLTMPRDGAVTECPFRASNRSEGLEGVAEGHLLGGQAGGGLVPRKWFLKTAEWLCCGDSGNAFGAEFRQVPPLLSTGMFLEIWARCLEWGRDLAGGRPHLGALSRS